VGSESQAAGELDERIGRTVGGVTDDRPVRIEDANRIVGKSIEDAHRWDHSIMDVDSNARVISFLRSAGPMRTMGPVVRGGSPKPERRLVGIE
jgi:hypothetical protein